MPIEGLPPTEATPPAATPPATPQTTPDAGATNTVAAAPGTGTEPAPTQATPEKTFTQADVDRIVQNRLKSAVKAEIKKLTGDGEATVEDLQRQLSESQTKMRSFEARESVNEYLTDARHKLNVKPENVRPIQELVIGRLEYGDDGKPTNVKEAVESVKNIAPALFANNPGSIDAGVRGVVPNGNDMNAIIRGQYAARHGN